MKIVHFSDTHLGYSEYSKVDTALGINQRELDVNIAFRKVIDFILEKKPDFVIHTGDLFDSSRPNNRAIHTALSELQRLSNAGIPTIIISGNHSTPRVAASGSIFEALTILPNIYPVYKKQYEKLKIGNVAVHIVPHTSTDIELCKELEKVQLDQKAKFNILGVHAGVTWDDVYKMGEFNELIIPGKILSRFKDFDYIALGHWHRYLPIKDISNAYYSGSTERFSFREMGYQKGVLLVDLETHKIELCPIDVREMVILGPVDCKGKEASDVMELIAKEKAKTTIRDCIVQLRLEKLARSTYIQIDLRQIRSLLAEAFNVDIHLDLVSESGKSEAGEKNIGALPLEFERFLNELDIPGVNKKLLVKLGIQYISKAQEQEQL